MIFLLLLYRTICTNFSNFGVTKRSERRVEINRAHFGSFSPVYVNGLSNRSFHRKSQYHLKN